MVLPQMSDAVVQSHIAYRKLHPESRVPAWRVMLMLMLMMTGSSLQEHLISLVPLLSSYMQTANEADGAVETTTSDPSIGRPENKWKYLTVSPEFKAEAAFGVRSPATRHALDLVCEAQDVLCL